DPAPRAGNPRSPPKADATTEIRGSLPPQAEAQDVSHSARSRIGPRSLRLAGIVRKDATIPIRPSPHAAPVLPAGPPATIAFGSVAGSGATGTGASSTPGGARQSASLSRQTRWARKP